MTKCVDGNSEVSIVGMPRCTLWMWQGYSALWGWQEVHCEDVGAGAQKM